MTIGGGSNITTTVGVARSSTAFTSANGTGSKTFSITNPRTGVRIDSTTGIVTASSAALAGTDTETVVVTDSAGATASTNIVITINTAVVVSGGSNIRTEFGRSDSSSALVVTGGTGSYIFSLQSPVSGVTVDTKTGRVYASASVIAGTYSQTVIATDSVGATGSILVSIVVNPPLTIKTATSTTKFFTVNGSTVTGQLGNSLSFSSAGVYAFDFTGSSWKTISLSLLGAGGGASSGGAGGYTYGSIDLSKIPGKKFWIVVGGAGSWASGSTGAGGFNGGGNAYAAWGYYQMVGSGGGATDCLRLA